MTDVRELVAAQQEAARLLTVATDTRLLAAAQLLATTVGQVAADDELRHSLRTPTRTPVDGAQLALLVWADWAVVLAELGWQRDTPMAEC